MTILVEIVVNERANRVTAYCTQQANACHLTMVVAPQQLLIPVYRMHIQRCGMWLIHVYVIRLLCAGNARRFPILEGLSFE